MPNLCIRSCSASNQREKEKTKKEKAQTPKSQSGVANCRNLPFGGRMTRGLTGASSIGGKCAKSPPMFIWGKRQKNRKRCDLWTLSVKGSGVIFTHKEGINTPCVRHKGRHPLIKFANMTSICFIFPFYYYYIFFLLFFFLFFFLLILFLLTPKGGE